MSFTSLNFLFFLLTVVIVNYCLPRSKRWILLLVASYYFYLNWQPIYALLLLATTIVTYVCSLQLDKNGKSVKFRKIICSIGCIFPLLSLVIFKYYHFITDSTTSALSKIGIYMEMPTLQFLMPIGISFYTFTAVGYLIDIYRRDYKPERNFGILSLFISFFAQITSGPIPRGGHLIPQLRQPASLNYDYVIGGLKTMLWGFFMKLCVANRLGIYVDVIYNNLNNHNGTTLLLASVLYTIQIYCDFAGYSLVAIGVARMLGIKLKDNFRRPYFASSIKEFWGRWHISLSTWFRDYVYIPLGGSRVSKSRNIFNLVATFLVSGLWHGAAWNYVLWGGLHGAGQSVEKLSTHAGKKDAHNILIMFLKILLVFTIINFLWVFFRLQHIDEIKTFFIKVFTQPGRPFFNIALVPGAIGITILMVKDIIDEYIPQFKVMGNSNFWISNIATGVLIAIIFLMGAFDSTSFIYYQF